MDRPAIRLFGSPTVTLGRRAVRLTPTAAMTLAWLVLDGGATRSRAAMAGALWPGVGESRARARLNTSLWRLRRVLEADGVAPGTHLTTQGSDHVWLNWEGGLDVDVRRFEDAAQAVLDGRATSPAEQQAIRSASRPLLEGHYEDFIVRSRDRIHLRYVQALERLVAVQRDAGMLDDALATAQDLVAAEPLSETSHRSLIAVHLDRADRSGAIRAFQACERVMIGELGVAPSVETRMMVSDLLGYDLVPRAVQPDALAAALASLDSAQRELDGVRRLLERLGAQAG